jgi:hypothetical protein
VLRRGYNNRGRGHQTDIEQCSLFCKIDGIRMVKIKKEVEVPGSVGDSQTLNNI